MPGRRAGCEGPLAPHVSKPSRRRVCHGDSSASAPVRRPRAVPRTMPSRTATPAAIASTGATPSAATARPATAGPPAFIAEKPTFSAALPSRRRPAGSRIATLAARVVARAVAAAVPADDGEREHERQREGRGDERERADGDRLGAVEADEDRARGEAVQARGERGHEQRGQELRGDEERRRRERVLCGVPHEDRERDGREPVRELVERVRAQQPAEAGQPERLEQHAHRSIIGARRCPT